MRRLQHCPIIDRIASSARTPELKDPLIKNVHWGRRRAILAQTSKHCAGSRLWE
jgi:hypothetical protein